MNSVYSIEQEGNNTLIKSSVAPYPIAQVFRFKNAEAAEDWLMRKDANSAVLPIENYYAYLKFSGFSGPVPPSWTIPEKLQEMASMVHFFILPGSSGIKHTGSVILKSDHSFLEP